MIINRPVAFPGTKEEAAANRRTHRFHTEFYGEDDYETRCMDCDCKPWHRTAEYPCGVEPPRETITYGEES